MNHCNLCGGEHLTILFTQKDIPVFQNKVYSTFEESLNAEISNVILSQCNYCKFVFNAEFDPSILNYNGDYQNEQANSALFVDHLNTVYNILSDYDIHDKKVVEIGCGKGYFFELLKGRGINITGFDPAYEGEDPSIIKDYFSSKYNVHADLIILRHTLEHITNPLDFLKEIFTANGENCLIYIEVPTFDWIIKNKAFEDIFYEHCNYFTIGTLKMLFEHSESGYLFNNQYIYLIANLKDLKKNIGHNLSTVFSDVFSSKIMNYKKGITKNHNLAIWGAGAKGSTFLNLMDPIRKYIKCVVDINPNKQNKYIAHTGHKIISPQSLKDFSVNNIIVMNPNYFEEIQKSTSNLSMRLIKINDYE